MIKLKDNMLLGVVIGLAIPFASFFILDTVLAIIVGGKSIARIYYACNCLIGELSSF